MVKKLVRSGANPFEKKLKVVEQEFRIVMGWCSPGKLDFYGCNCYSQHPGKKSCSHHSNSSFHSLSLEKGAVQMPLRLY